MHCPEGQHNSFSTLFLTTPEGCLKALLHDPYGECVSNKSETVKKRGRVKSVNFGHQVNSVTYIMSFANSRNPDETAPYEPSHQDFHYLLS